MEYKFEYEKIITDKQTKDKKEGDAYVARSRPTSKLVIARLMNTLTNIVIFCHFSMTEKKRRKIKKLQNFNQRRGTKNKPKLIKEI